VLAWAVMRSKAPVPELTAAVVAGPAAVGSGPKVAAKPRVNQARSKNGMVIIVEHLSLMAGLFLCFIIQDKLIWNTSKQKHGLIIKNLRMIRFNVTITGWCSKAHL
jgi:hypothetical protein